MLKFLVIGLTTAITISCAYASPPPRDSEDWQIMAPFVEWVTTRHDQHNRWCCDIGDARPVKACMASGEPSLSPDSINETKECESQGPSDKPINWYVLINGAHYPGEKTHWLQVPEERVIKDNTNPTGHDIVWMYQGRVQCFAPTALF